MNFIKKSTIFLAIFSFLLVFTFSKNTEANSCYKFSFSHLFPTEAEYCATCNVNQMTGKKGGIFKLNLLVPTTACFKQSSSQKLPSSREHRKPHTICYNNKPKRVKHPPCNTDEYVNTTASVFHEVSQCLNLDPTYFFALLNRESRFKITATSPTGASCYGQLTGIAIKDVNRLFLSANGRHLKYLRSVKKSCATVDQHVNILATKDIQANDDIITIKTSKSKCELYSNPYTCMAYAGMYYKHLLNKSKALLDSLDIIQAQSNGSKEFLSFFRDKKHFKVEGKNDTNPKRVSLFQDKKLMAQILAMYSYNGGTSVLNRFKGYTNTLKGNIWSTSKKTRRTYEAQLFYEYPFGISTSDFIHSFSNHILAVNRKKYKEASEFPKNIFKDYLAVTGKLSPACGNINAKKILTRDKRFTAM